MSANPGADTVLGRVLATAERLPTAAAFIAGDLPISYRDTLALWASGVAILRARGVGPGRRVALTMGQSAIQLVMLLAIARLGALAVPVSPFLGAAQRSALFARLGIDLVVADRPEYAPPGAALVLVRELAAAADATVLRTVGPWPGAEDLFMLSLTTGTTGPQKAIAQSHGGFVRRVMRNLHGVGVPPRIIPPGLNIVVALSGAFHALFEGGVVVIPASYDNARFLDAVRRHEVTTIMLPPANMGNLARASTQPLPSLRQVRFLGGTPAASLISLCRERLSPNLFTVYASVETATVAYADARTLEHSPTSVGRPCADATIEVVDDEDRVLPSGQSGHLRVRFDGMAQGYFEADPGDLARFRDGWFHMPDVGHFDAEGLLYVEGRSDDILNIGGRKVLPSALEAWLEEFPGVREAAVFLRPGSERLEAAVVAAEGLDVAALARFAAEKLELLAPQRFHQVPSLPRNAMGKLQREKLVL